MGYKFESEKNCGNIIIHIYLKNNTHYLKLISKMQEEFVNLLIEFIKIHDLSESLLGQLKEYINKFSITE